MGRKGKEIEDDFIGEGDEEREKSPFQELLGMVLYIGVVLVITFLIITFVGQRTHVSGDSMKNTLNHGDQLIVDKLTYRFQDPVRYDIIVFPYQYEENTFYIKRIIGLPGETVQIADGEIFINGEVLMESYGREVIQDPGTAAEPIRLGEDEYFVLGDNRNNSEDSRYANIGNVKKEYIIGKAWFIVSPFQDFGFLD